MMQPHASPSATAVRGDIAEDARELHRLGYAQELRRRMNGFSNFAISFSIICILAGGITSLHLGVSAVGGAAAGIVWPLGAVFCFVVALGMAQIASAFPTAGGLYHWSSLLGGKGWGWATAWLNLGGVVLVTAAVNVGAYTLFVGFVGPLAGIDPAGLGFVHQILGVTIITVSQAWLNHTGIRTVTVLTDFSGYLIFAVALVLTVALVVGVPALDWGRLFAFANVTGTAGGEVWPQTGSGLTALLLALMWPIYTITGFDASAHTAEETVAAARNVPRGLLRSVAMSGLCGWVMVCAFVLAMPDLGEAAKQGANIFPWLMAKALPGSLGSVLWIGIVLANYLCGLACVTSTSRMIYAFARDGGLPASVVLRRVSPRWGTPVAAIWTTAALAVALTLYTPAYSTLTTACVIFLYLSYAMPTAAGIFALGKTWTHFGPFRLPTPIFRVLGVITVLGVVALVWIGVQPPNERALVVTVATLGLLTAAWWLGVRRRFAGPPVAKW